MAFSQSVCVVDCVRFKSRDGNEIHVEAGHSEVSDSFGAFEYWRVTPMTVDTSSVVATGNDLDVNKLIESNPESMPQNTDGNNK